MKHTWACPGPQPDVCVSLFAALVLILVIWTLEYLALLMQRGGICVIVCIPVYKSFDVKLAR